MSMANRILAALIVALALVPVPARAAHLSDAETARHIASMLGAEFQPESVSVSVLDSRAYAEMRGAVMSGIRIDSMRLDALLTRRDEPLSDDVKSLAKLIGFSRGELTLRADDVNAYFDSRDTRGFSNLRFDFAPEGFKAEGMFSAQMLFKITIRLRAEGELQLGSDGVYLDNVSIFTENIKQPDIVVDQILSRVNPLITWSRIPFKVQFREITMDTEKAVMTGYPTECGGVTYVWTRETGEALPAGR